MNLIEAKGVFCLRIVVGLIVLSVLWAYVDGGTTVQLLGEVLLYVLRDPGGSLTVHVSPLMETKSSRRGQT
jgi:hypothetical protein